MVALATPLPLLSLRVAVAVDVETPSPGIDVGLSVSVMFDAAPNMVRVSEPFAFPLLVSVAVMVAVSPLASLADFTALE
jgi:hypothetical protein